MMITISVIVYAVSFRPLSVDEESRRVALQEIASWVFGQAELPGNDLPLYDRSFYADRNIVLDIDGVYVYPDDIDYLHDVSIVPPMDAASTLRRGDYEGYAHVSVRHVASGTDCMHFKVTVQFGPRGGQGYSFTVIRTLAGLRYTGVRDWVS